MEKTLLCLVVYSWEQRSQNRLLARCLRPLAHELESTKADTANTDKAHATPFWFSRYDARGPHILALWHVEPARFAETAERIAAQVQAHIAAQPSRQELSRAKLEKIHAGCRGNVQCEADARAGLAANNTFHIFAHPPRGFPFWLSEGVASEVELWQLLHQLTLWNLDQLAAAGDKGATAAAVRWIAAMDRELCRLGADAAGYWRYHASTLLLTLEEQLAADPARILGLLPRLIGDANRRTFSHIWAQAEEAQLKRFPDLARVAEIVLSSTGEPRLERWQLLRAIDHIALKQLGLAVPLHMPLVLYAWQRHLAPVNSGASGTAALAASPSS